MTTRINYTVSLSPDKSVATISKSRSKATTVAGVLGVEKTTDNRNIIYLDTLIHSPSRDDVVYEGWEPSGVISTILTQLAGVQNEL